MFRWMDELFQQSIFTVSGKLGAVLPATTTSDEDHCMVPTDSSAGTSKASMPTKKKNRCWPGYEPVKGKSAHEQGSCRPKAHSKLSSSEKSFRAKRRKQLDKWEAEHPHTRKSASQGLRKPPGSGRGSASKKKSTTVSSARRRTNSPRKRATSHTR